jgi:hypothetical protein
VIIEPDYKDPTKLVNKVKKFISLGESENPKIVDADIPF